MNRICFILIFLVIPCAATAQQYQLDSLVHTVKGVQFIAAQKYDARSIKAEGIESKEIK